MRRARAFRVRAKLSKAFPRLTVFRSNKYIWAQIIDDKKGMTIVSASSKKIENSGTKLEKSRNVGRNLAQLAVKKGVKQVVFDRGGYKYHGRVKALAEGAREGGLKF